MNPFYCTQRLTVEDNRVTLDYMGAAEFEWGAPQNALRYLGKLHHEDRLVEMLVQVLYNNKPYTLKLICNKDFEALFKNGITIERTKEWLGIDTDRYQAWLPCDPTTTVEHFERPGIILFRNDPKVRDRIISLIKVWENHYINWLELNKPPEEPKTKYMVLLRGTLLNKADTREEANTIVASLSAADRAYVIIRPY